MIRLLTALTVVLAAGACGDGKTAPSGPKTELHLITSLPLLFGETFGLESKKPEIVSFLEERYRLTAIDLPSQLPQGANLLMVQPRALPAEELVALDDWVRAGGRLVLLADPRLEWPSERPLGDPLHPPPMFADTGLLLHWGLRLDAPDKAGPVEIGQVTYVSPGRLAGSGDCAVDPGAVVARCRLGKGEAVVVADADWLNSELVAGGGDTFDSQMRALDALLGRLTR
jgi:hypothetical protein